MAAAWLATWAPAEAQDLVVVNARIIVGTGEVISTARFR
jgi:hypothetical protein